MFISAIVPAAGIGRRIKNKLEPKPFLPLGGKPIIAHTLRALSCSEEINEIVLVVSASLVERVGELAQRKKDKPIKVVPGAKFRSLSVKNGLEALDPASEIVLIHDGARPFVSRELIGRSIEAAVKFGAAICALPVKDTLKEASGDVFIASTVDRSSLWKAQTPQTFRRDLIMRAYQEAGPEEIEKATDSAMLVEKLGIKVKLIEGEERNIKITTDEDLRIAELMLNYNKQKVSSSN